MNIDRVVGQEPRTFFCYRMGSVAGVFHLISHEFVANKQAANKQILAKIKQFGIVSEAVEASEIYALHIVLHVQTVEPKIVQWRMFDAMRNLFQFAPVVHLVLSNLRGLKAMSAVKRFISELEDKASAAKGDVVSLIKADHKLVDKLFVEYENAKSKSDKKALLEKIIEELHVHTTVEEELVYPQLEKKDSEGTNEAFEEHHIVEGMLKELMQVHTINELVDAKVKVLCELVKHHVKEEETELLPELKKSGADLEKMGEAMLAEKEKIKGQAMKPGEANTHAKEFKRKAS